MVAIATLPDIERRKILHECCNKKSILQQLLLARCGGSSCIVVVVQDTMYNKKCNVLQSTSMCVSVWCDTLLFMISAIVMDTIDDNG